MVPLVLPRLFVLPCKSLVVVFGQHVHRSEVL
jgi:hypothetical protein